ncbi:hypothetical protein H4V97_003076 [Flavobacterium sp. CG_23.5]|nr:hypothetical protein [Flavobacterium sp. CG_9.10]MBP2284758.1 hypothetical protein [Flavobacterium sp. CG_23.5]
MSSVSITIIYFNNSGNFSIAFLYRGIETPLIYSSSG